MGNLFFIAQFVQFVGQFLQLFIIPRRISAKIFKMRIFCVPSNQVLCLLDRLVPVSYTHLTLPTIA